MSPHWLKRNLTISGKVRVEESLGLLQNNTYPILYLMMSGWISCIIFKQQATGHRLTQLPNCSRTNIATCNIYKLEHVGYMHGTHGYMCGECIHWQGLKSDLTSWEHARIFGLLLGNISVKIINIRPFSSNIYCFPLK